MSKIIPWFYSDLLSRIAPGALSLALLGLAIPTAGKEFSEWLSGTCGSANVVLAPLVYVGIAYVIGLLYETYLNPVTDRTVFRWAFRTALKMVPLKTPCTRSTQDPTLKDLTHRSVAVFHVVTTERKSAEFDHVTRFHAEGKMFFFMLLPLIAFTLLIASGAVAPDWLTPQYVGVFFVALPLCGLSSFLRFRRRSIQIIRFFEHYESVETESYTDKLLQVQTEIRRYAAGSDARRR